MRAFHFGLAAFWVVYGSLFLVRAARFDPDQPGRRWQLNATGYRVFGVLGLLLALVWLALAIAK